eukprot:g15570.t1
MYVVITCDVYTYPSAGQNLAASGGATTTGGSGGSGGSSAAAGGRIDFAATLPNIEVDTPEGNRVSMASTWSQGSRGREPKPVKTAEERQKDIAEAKKALRNVIALRKQKSPSC